MSNKNLIQNLKQMIENIETNRVYFDKPTLNRAFAQEVACAVTFEDEETGSRHYKALVKGMENIETNKTIGFRSGVLTFVSPDSGKTRMVTTNGCHNSCDCNGLGSYHLATHKILTRYFALLPKPEVKPANAPYFKQPLYTESKRVKIGNVWI